MLIINNECHGYGDHYEVVTHIIYVFKVSKSYKFNVIIKNTSMLSICSSINFF